MAMPMEGTCEVVTAPTILAMIQVLDRIELGPELLEGHRILLCANVLHGHAINRGELENIVDVASRANHAQPVARGDKTDALGGQTKATAIADWAGNECLAVGGA